MTRILSLFFLILTISCANTRPEPAAEETGTATPSATTSPAVTPKQEQTPATVAETKPTATPRTEPAQRAARREKPARKPSATKPEVTPEVSAGTPEIVEIIEIVETSEVAQEQAAEPAAKPETAVAPTATSPQAPAFSATTTALAEVPHFKAKKHFLPTGRRFDREINKIKFAYKGEVMMGLTASYGTLASDDTDFMVIVDNINAKATIATVKPFIGYFYRDNNCIGVRFGYNHASGTLDTGGMIDLGESNDTTLELPYLDFKSDNYSFGIFHRSYAGLDPKGRFGLFAEFELAVSTGTSEFAYETDGKPKRTFSDNTQLKLSFNPGAAVYIFPNVCATLSFGLGGVQYTSVKQKDEDGNLIGTRKASKMKFKLNVAAINIGMTVHLWDKKKQ